MHLTFINRCYWPDSEATGQLLTELCEYLAEKHQVSCIVGQPNFIAKPTEFLREGIEKRNKVSIHRLVHSQFEKGARFGRIRNLVSFTNSVRKYLKTYPTETDSVWICETDPFLLPMVVGPAARRAKKNGKKLELVYYLQDIYPDVAVALNVTRNSLPIRLLRSRLCHEYAQADRIVLLDEDMLDRLVSWGLPREKFRVVPNWMDCSTVQPIKTDNPFRLMHGIDSKFVVMHSGNMGMTQRLEVLVRVMKRSEINSTTQLLLVGNGAKRKELELQSQGQENVTILDYQPRERLAESLSAADLHVVTMDRAITGCLAPSKLYGILASGTAVLAIVPKGNAVWRLVQQQQLGWCVEPGDEQGIANAMIAASQKSKSELLEMGMRGRELATSKFDRQICCDLFESAVL